MATMAMAKCNQHALHIASWTCKICQLLLQQVAYLSAALLAVIEPCTFSAIFFSPTCCCLLLLHHQALSLATLAQL